MKKSKAIKIIKEYQAWRLGAQTPQLKPKLITKALKKIIKMLEL